VGITTFTTALDNICDKSAITSSDGVFSFASQKKKTKSKNLKYHES